MADPGLHFASPKKLENKIHSFFNINSIITITIIIFFVCSCHILILIIDAIIVFLVLFPTSLCGVLVFGCARPPASCLPPTPTQPSHTRNLLTHNWLWWRVWFPFGTVVAAAVCVAGVALGDIEMRFAWQAWHLATATCILRGRRGTYGPGWLWSRAWFPFGAVVRQAGS